MKKFTRIASLLLALVMVLGLAATAFAADETYTITIQSRKTNHTYEVYQIFAGDVATDEEGNKILSNITWGADVTEEGQTALLSFGKAEGEEPFASVQELAESLTADNAADFAKAVNAYLAETPTAAIRYRANAGYQAEVPAGYYLVKNPDAAEMNEGERTDLILEVVGDATVVPKATYPTITKSVWNNNDTTKPQLVEIPEGIAVWDIGDSVLFELTGTIPSDLPSYESYEYIIHDEMSAGLTPPALEDVNVGLWSDLTQLTEQGMKWLTMGEDYTITATEKGFDVVLDLVAVTEDYDTDTWMATKVIVNYDAVLNENAAVGAHDNTNKAWIEYNGTPGTPDTAWVGTVQLVVNKVDEKNQPLAGAEFKLYKFFMNDQTHQGTDTLQIGAKQYIGVWEECENQFTVSEDGTVFTAKGLDGGGYKLVETKTPDGYNTAEDLIFAFGTACNYEDGYITRMEVITDNADQFTLTTRTIQAADGEATEYIGLETTVINESGVILPSTGGMGTTLFYILGAVLVLGAAVLLVTKRRMAAED